MSVCPTIAKIIVGEKRELTARVVHSNGEPYDLTGYTAIKARFKNKNGAAIEKTVGAGIVIVNEILGKMTITLESADTLNLKIEEKGSFEIEITKPTEVRIVPYERVLEIKARVV